MADMHFEKMVRLLTRCAEIAYAPNAKVTVKATYTGILEAPAEAFLDAQRTFVKVESLYAREKKDAAAALEKIDQPYREARSVVQAFVPTAIVPLTLKQLTTDTDRIHAIEGLIEIANEHQATPWAAEIVNGPFGQRATSTIHEITDAVTATRALDEARKNRTVALDPAYEAYVRFKRVVRHAMGQHSIEYKRIHLRNAPNGEVEPAPAPAPGAPPSAPG